MVKSKPKKQDIVKLRDECFENVLTSKNDNNKIELLIKILSFSNKINKPSERFHIWVSKPTDDPEFIDYDTGEKGEEIKEVY